MFVTIKEIITYVDLIIIHFSLALTQVGIMYVENVK